MSIASAPCGIEHVPSLLDDIASFRDLEDLGTNRDARLTLLAQVRKLVHSLETPRETMLKHCGAETASFYMIALGINVGLFTELARDGGKPKKAADIAFAIGFSVDGLRRILRHLAAMYHIKQTGPDEYAPNNFSKALTIPIVCDGYLFYRDTCILPMHYIHDWFMTKSYQPPTTVVDNPFTFGNQTSKTFFEYMTDTPVKIAHFNHHMGGYRLGRPAWFDSSIYPVYKKLLPGIDADGTTLVDIGGNKGHDLERFLTAFPDIPGKIILQDRQSVLDEAPATLAKRIQKMDYDFFTPQPVQGARAYYMHHILHDWPDEKCVAIVEQLKGAMKPGYSKLIINEHIIPATGAHWEATYLDLYMMAMFGSRERTEDDWEALLEDKCGLKVKGIWNPGNGVEGVIECEI